MRTQFSVTFFSVALISSGCNVFKSNDSGSSVESLQSSKVYAIAYKPVQIWSVENGVAGNCLIKGSRDKTIRFEVTPPKEYSSNKSKVWASFAQPGALADCKFKSFAVQKGDLVFVKLDSLGKVVAGSSYPGSASYPGF